MSIYATRIHPRDWNHYCHRCGRQIDGTEARRHNGNCTDCHQVLKNEATEADTTDCNAVI